MEKQVKQSLLNGLDPMIGYAYSDSTYLQLEREREDYLNGIARIGRNANKDIRIAVLGGSTSDISYQGNWMRVLYDLLEKQGLKPLVICAGMSGYSTSQEVIKLIRDILPLNPSIVVSLSGVNDLGFIHAASPKRPFIHKYQQLLGKFIVDKYGTTAPTTTTYFHHSIKTKSQSLNGLNPEMSLGKLVLGVEQVQESFESWHKNIRLQKAICSEFEIDYFACLQPIFGFGDYQSSEEESRVYNEFVKERYVHKVPYDEALKFFYKGAKKIVKANPDYLYDLTDIFAEENDVYSDPRHLNAHGNRILAEKVFSILEAKRLLFF